VEFAGSGSGGGSIGVVDFFGLDWSSLGGGGGGSGSGGLFVGDGADGGVVVRVGLDGGVAAHFVGGGVCGLGCYGLARCELV